MTASDAAAPVTPTPTVTRTRTSVDVGRQTFARAVSAEWLKLTSLRSTWVTSLLTVLITAGAGVALAVAFANLDDDPVAWQMIPGGTTFGEIVVAVLGALVITSEYSSGQIRSSLAAVPRRTRFLAAKALVIAVWSFLLGAVSILVAWAISTPLMRAGTISLSDHRMLGFVWGGGLAYAGIALMSLGLGLLLRSTAGSVTLVVSLLFVVQIPLGIARLRWDWAAKAYELIPSTSVNAVVDPFSTQVEWADAAGSPMWLSHTAAVGCFAAWSLVPLVLAWVVFTRRDA